MEPKGLGIFFDFHHLKSCRLQAITERVGKDRHEGVAYMNQPHKQALQAIGTDKSAAWSQDAPNFAEKLVLKAGSVHMVQHGEANGAGELCVCEWHLSGIALDDLNVAAVQTRGERFGYAAINFDGRQVRNLFSQEIGGEAGPRSQLQHV